jgi:uncharacterized protein YkwD
LRRIPAIISAFLAALALGGSYLPATTNTAEATYICDAPDVVIDEQEALLLQLVNNYRGMNGLQPLARSESLISSAGWMAGDLGWRNYFAHTDVFGRSVDVRQNDCGNWGPWKGENIAAGTNVDNAAAVISIWQNSPGHNAELLNPNYRYAGVSRFYSPASTYGWYWVIDFSSD